MEVSVGDYGRMIFEILVGNKYSGMPDHWKAIQSKAEPLVRQLLALNDKMPNGGYKITGYVKEDGKTVLPTHERIRQAMVRLWGVKKEDLKEDDRVWVVYGEIEMEAIYTDPAPVLFVKGSGRDLVVAIDRDREGIYKIEYCDTILKAPDDWDEDSETKYGDDYWLARADELGI